MYLCPEADSLLVAAFWMECRPPDASLVKAIAFSCSSMPPTATRDFSYRLSTPGTAAAAARGFAGISAFWLSRRCPGQLDVGRCCLKAAASWAGWTGRYTGAPDCCDVKECDEAGRPNLGCGLLLPGILAIRMREPAFSCWGNETHTTAQVAHWPRAFSLGVDTRWVNGGWRFQDGFGCGQRQVNRSTRSRFQLQL